MKTCDVTKLARLLHDDLLFNLPNGETITKAMDLDTYNSGNMQISDISAVDLVIKLIADNAIVSTTIQTSGRFFDHPLDGTYKILRVWKQEKEYLQVIACSSVVL